jgi:hypothetical protein
VSQLLSDAREEQSSQAVAVDCWDARRCDPTNQTEADHTQVSPKPIPWKAVTSHVILVLLLFYSINFFYNQFTYIIEYLFFFCVFMKSRCS